MISRKYRSLIELVEYLEKENCEIGLHGTVNSAQNYENLDDIISKLNHVSKQKVSGIRQHRLIFDLPYLDLLKRLPCCLQPKTKSIFWLKETFQNLTRI